MNINKYLVTLTIFVLISSTVVGINLNEQQSVYQIIEEDCGCYETTIPPEEYFNDFDNEYIEGYPVLERLPPISENDLLWSEYDKNPQPTNSFNSLPNFFSWKEYGGDWTTPAKNQLSCGSCWAFSTLSTMEAIINIASGIPWTDIDLSEQYILSCLGSSGDCDGGWMHSAFQAIKSTSSGSTGNGINGVTIESCFPYLAKDYIPCSDKCEDWDYISLSESGKLWELEDWGYTQTFNPNDPDDRDTIKSWIIDKGPLSVALYHSSGCSSYWNTHDDPNDYYYGTEMSYKNHGVLLAGYKDDEFIPNGGYWILKNSWGTNFGYNGFYNVAYGCLDIGSYVAWCTVPEWTSNPGSGLDLVLADFDYEPKYPTTGDTIDFKEEATGNVTYYEWDFDGDNISDINGIFAKRPKWIYNEEGEHTVKLIVSSSGGLTSEITRTVEVRDNWPPISAPMPEYYSGTNPIVEFEARHSYDVDGNIVGYEWDFDGDGTVDSTEPNPIYEFPGNGEYFVTLTVIDDEGIRGTGESEIKIDIYEPPVTVVYLGGIGNEDEQWFNSDVMVEIQVTDWTGVTKLYYSIDGEEFNEISCGNKRFFKYDNIIVSGDGIHTIDFYSIDTYGNVENVKSKDIKIDENPPTISITLTGEEIEGMYVGPVQFTLVGNDEHSGIDKLEYLIDMKYLSEYTAPFTIEEYGSHVVYCVAIDAAGNSVLECIEIEIDHPPSTFSINGPNTVKIGENYKFTAITTDPNGDDIYYLFDWGDNTEIFRYPSSGYVNSGDEAEAEHTWENEGVSILTVTAIDIYGAERTETMVVAMNKYKFNNLFYFIQLLFEKFPILNQLLN